MPKIPLSPMLVQYLVGLCCLKWDPDAVNVTIGDMVLDPAAGKQRDIDVTVTVSQNGGITHAFKAYEVKHESKPLDVADVEQLCLKLMDMPSLTHKAIVSASGYTSSAKSKAAQHNITLYELHPWTRPLKEQFPALNMEGTAQECFPMSQNLLCWIEEKLEIFAPDSNGRFIVQHDDDLFDASGRIHNKYKKFYEYREHLLLNSTEILLSLEPATSVLRTFPIPYTISDGTIPAGPAWPHTHSLDIRSDEIYVNTKNKLFRIDLITINGHLQWQRDVRNSLYYVMQDTIKGEPFAGSLISLGKREGNMTALVFSPENNTISIHFVQLKDTQLNFIRGLTLETPSAGSDS